jgi:photosystem II stability/assembly factor-like uncharacterized protein
MCIDGSNAALSACVALGDPMYHRIIRTALITVALSCAGALCFSCNRADSPQSPVSTSVFQDVLDTPALKSPIASKTLYNGIAMAGDRLVCVGQRGHILYSDDQGKTWTQADVPVSSDLTAVNFPTSQKGWAVGHDGVVLHSNDGGVTWSKQLDGRTVTRVISDHYDSHPPTGPDALRQQEDIRQIIDTGVDKSFLDVWFENENNGFAVGAFNLIIHTVDGGKSWEPWIDRTENPKQLHFYAIKSVDQDLYICGEQGLVLKLNRQVDSFKAIPVPYKGTFFGITGKPGVVVVYGIRGNVFCSKDEGMSWQKIEVGTTIGLTGATATEDGRIILVSLAGQVLVSVDDGANFTPVKVEKPFPTAAILALDKESVMLAGLYGMQKQSLK